MRVAIVGNSGSGKSTLARTFAPPVLDLDTIFWEPGKVAAARDPAQSASLVREFCSAHAEWVVEGCYASLIRIALEFEPELILLDPGLERCLANCRARPWEPHKYASLEEQNRHLDFLLEWVAAYYSRDDEMSRTAHEALFVQYGGPKRVAGAFEFPDQ
ncbi:MAG: shikimate kinase [Acidobacteria bacterium]|nr:shikimate kinase [Acidobacteriota bacterium]